MAKDLGRYLRDESIVAKPPRPITKLWRLARRRPVVCALLLTLPVVIAQVIAKRGLPSMPVLIGTGVSGVIEGKLYVMTAADGYEGRRNYLHVSDPELNSWDKLRNAPLPHNEGAAGVIDGKLYLVGGHDWKGNESGQLDVYDPPSDTWITRSPMPAPRDNSAGAVFNGRLYVVEDAPESRHLIHSKFTIPPPMCGTADRRCVSLAAALVRLSSAISSMLLPATRLMAAAIQ